MTLELSSEEIRSLMHMVSLALYVAEANQDKEYSEELHAMQVAADKVFEAGWRDGHRDIAEFDPTRGQYMLREEYETDSVYAKSIQEFEDDFFWGELASALADRDLRLKGGQSLDPVELSERLRDLEDHYLDHFTDHGVDHLRLINPTPHQ
ncbi:MAG: hypothetical protein ACKV19_22305 [Verrucomicrobiales bacterium]